MANTMTAGRPFETTEGLELIWQLQADPANIVFSSVTAELEGMAYYDAEYRWPAVRGSGGSITVTVPRAGTFHPAVVVYDTAGPERYTLEIDGSAVGEFVADQDDRRQRLYFLDPPLDFLGGEKLTFRTGATGSHITEDILLLAERPPIRARLFEIRQVEAGHVVREGEAQLRLTWITTWPAACTIEYGLTAEGVQRVTEETPLANHRVYLTGLQPGGVYHYRILAPRPDGERVVTAAATVTFAPPPPFAGTARRERLSLNVENPYDFALESSPVTSGVPFFRGELGDTEHLRLLDDAGSEIPVQAKITARWQDGSIKWLLLSFLATVAPQDTAAYILEYGTAIARAEAASPLRHTRDGEALTVDTGPLRVRFDASRSAFPVEVRAGSGAQERVAFPGSGPLMAVEIADAAGKLYSTRGRVERLEIEESGPVRTVVSVIGRHRSDAGEAFFEYGARFTFYAGSTLVRVEYTWGNDWDGAEFAEFAGVTLSLPLGSDGAHPWLLGLGDGREARGEGDAALTQWRDDAFRLAPGPEPPGAGRAEGWIDVGGSGGSVTAAVRHFWQLYPKALRLTGGALALDLCPAFPEGTYDDCSRLDEIKWFYYLMRGRYKVRRGVRKQHEVLLQFHDGPPEAEAARKLARVFQEPLIAACAPERYSETGVFGPILPATQGRFPDYEAVCEKVYRGYLRRREEGHEYGMLNFGDTWGERAVNWFNGEYDHHHAFLMQFIRTGDRRWFFLGEQAARHAIDVDTCHHGPHRGGEWIHAMGHTGDYFTEPHEGHGYPRGRFSDSHTWTEGFCDWYFLSGDPTASANAALVADYYAGDYLNHYDWTNCRTNGWHLILTMAAYRATDDPYYLNAARIIVERTLERQSPGGGWHRQMVPGHCHDMPRHRGEANFMLGVLANGLEEYYREVQDPRVAAAVLGGAKQCVEELWVPESDGFRYTSCPNMKGYTANNDMTAAILFFADALGGDPCYGEYAMRAMRAAFAGGIGSIAHLRWTPHLLCHMDRIARRQTSI
jgi:PcRGLX-like N-terminal RIFT barrel domain/PcRGLX-like protein central beta sandwich domain